MEMTRCEIGTAWAEAPCPASAGPVEAVVSSHPAHRGKREYSGFDLRDSRVADTAEYDPSTGGYVLRGLRIPGYSIYSLLHLLDADADAGAVEFGVPVAQATRWETRWEGNPGWGRVPIVADCLVSVSRPAHAKIVGRDRELGRLEPGERYRIPLDSRLGELWLVGVPAEGLVVRLRCEGRPAPSYSFANADGARFEYEDGDVRPAVR
jgi:hypothetical protein